MTRPFKRGRGDFTPGSGSLFMQDGNVACLNSQADIGPIYTTGEVEGERKGGGGEGGQERVIQGVTTAVVKSGRIPAHVHYRGGGSKMGFKEGTYRLSLQLP